MTKVGLYKPPATEDEKKLARDALTALLNSPEFGGNKNKMAQKFGFTRNAVSFWFSKGYMGSYAATELSKDESIGIPLVKLRPDIQARLDAQREKLDKIQPPTIQA